MGFDETDPTARRRWEPEAQRERDAEIMELYRAGVSQRAIAKRLKCTLGTVQHVLRRELKRAQKMTDALTTGEPADVVAAIDDELTCDDVHTTDDVERLTSLEHCRARHLPPDHPTRQVIAQAVATGWRPWPRTTPGPVYPIVDDGGSWREHCDRAMADDSGTDRDDDW